MLPRAQRDIDQRRSGIGSLNTDASSGRLGSEWQPSVPEPLPASCSLHSHISRHSRLISLVILHNRLVRHEPEYEIHALSPPAASVPSCNRLQLCIEARKSVYRHGSFQTACGTRLLGFLRPYPHPRYPGTLSHADRRKIWRRTGQSLNLQYFDEASARRRYSPPIEVSPSLVLC